MPGEEIESLKPEDVVVTSTPQTRREEDKNPADEPPAGEGDELEGVEGDEGEENEGDAGEEGEGDAGEEGEGDAGEEGEESEGEEESEEEVIDAIDYAALSDQVGLDLDSEEAVLEALEELAEYKKLSPALQKAIEIERNKGDVAAYFKALSNDPSQLSDRDALWEQYVAENPKRVAGNPKFARLDFDRKLDKEYSLLNEYEKLSASDREDFLEEHKDEIEYLKEKRKFDAEAARASLQEAREKATFHPVEPKGGAMSEEKLQEVIRNHEAGYKKALAEFDVVSLDLGDDLEFNVSLSESNKKVAQDWMRNPDAFLQELGFSKDKIDYHTLAGWATLIADIKYGTFGDRLRQALLDSKDIQTLEQTLDAPGMTKTKGDKPIISGDEWDAVGAAFEKKRMETKKRR